MSRVDPDSNQVDPPDPEPLRKSGELILLAAVDGVQRMASAR